MNFLLAALGAVGSAVQGFFGFKGAQADVIKSAIDVAKSTEASDAQREQSIATIIAAEANSGSPITRVWRPLTMLVFLIDFHLLIWALLTGHFPKELLSTLPPVMDKLFDVIMLGLGGYIGGRSLEKIVQTLGISNVLRNYISKKLA